MDWINYHHLLYFWTVARSGSVTKAAEELLVAQPTISGQIRLLEDSLGDRLFQKSGRKLVLTDFGQMVYRYADEIFSIGRELTDVVRGRPAGRPVRFTVGIADVLPKLVVYRILEPVLSMAEPVHLVCHEDRTDRLLADLSMQSLDLVLADVPIPPQVRVRGYNHLLGKSPVGVYAAPKVAAKYRKRFPESLDGAPWLLPLESAMIRRALDHWFQQGGIKPTILGEFQDSALLKVFARAQGALFAAPLATDSEVRRLYGAELVGRVDGVEESFYAISVERRVKHPAVLRIIQAAEILLSSSATLD